MADDITLRFFPEPYDKPALAGGDQPGEGGRGGDGSDGTYKYDSGSCKWNCDVPPSKGDTGKDGIPGNDGSDGARGLDGPVCPWTLTEVIGKLTIHAGGGDGQTGGRGGRGQNGGPGGNPGRPNPKGYSGGNTCGTAGQGDQGKGGRGGKGGNAGPGGAGAQITIYYNKIEGSRDVVISSGKPGDPGAGGDPGSGVGNLGKGDNGKTAEPGSVSKVTLEPM